MRPLDTPQSQEGLAPPCPLCWGTENDLYYISEEPRHYFLCSTCALIYLHPSEYLSPPAERARYELHENDPADEDYVRFLRRLVDPVMECLRPGAQGLDFGCGPVPVLSGLLTSAGFPCAAYDPFFAPDETLLAKRYDYVTSCEVVEHAHDPAHTFATLRRLLAPGGLLGVMTRFYGNEGAFADWWYRRDPTHVCFYTGATMRWIAKRHGLQVGFPRPDVALFTEPVA